MNVVFACGQCGQSYQVGESLAGKKVKCKGCQSVLTIPFPDQPTRPTPPPPAPRARPPVPPPPRASNPPDRAPDAWDDLSPPPFKPSQIDPSTPPPLRRSRTTSAPSGSLKYVYATIGGVSALIVLLLLVLVFSRGGGSSPGPSPYLADAGAAYLIHKQFTSDGLARLAELTALLAEITDPATAQLRGPLVEGSAQQITLLAARGDLLPPLSPDLRSRLDQELGPDRDAALSALRSQLARLQADPSLSPILGPAIRRGLGPN